MSGGGLNIVGFCRALEAARDKDSTVSYSKSCTAIRTNGGKTSITESKMKGLFSIFLHNKHLWGLVPLNILLLLL